MRDDIRPELIPTLPGFKKEIHHDNLDHERVIDYFGEGGWFLLSQISRPVDTGENKTEIHPVSSSGIVSWTIPEFLHMKGGALTGIFFSPDGTFKRIQKYFIDVTKLV